MLKLSTLAIVLLWNVRGAFSFAPHTATNIGTQLSHSKPLLGNSRDVSDAQSEERGIYGYPLTVIAREESSAPLRPIRLQVFGLTAACSFAVVSLRAAGLLGVEAASNFLDSHQSLPGIPACALALGLCIYFWVEDVKVRRSSLRILNEEYERELAGENRLERRAKKKKGKKGRSSLRELDEKVASEVEEDVSTPPDVAIASAFEAPSGKSAPGGIAGAWNAVTKELRDINEQSYQRALLINKELEDKGVLPRIDEKRKLENESADDQPSSSDPQESL